MPYPQNVQRIPTKSAAKPQGGELALIRKIRQRVRTSPRGQVRLGIGDDCALLHPRPGEEIAITTDLSIAGHHFWPATHPPESIGHRALARGLSDLAAMGARPIAAFVSLAVPEELAGEWTTRFYDGLLKLANAHKTTLAGGDLSEAPLPLADIVLVGAVHAGKALLRSGARAGQILYVTGTLGGSAAGLARLAAIAETGQPTPKQRRLSHPTSIPASEQPLALHLYPQPRIAQGLWLRNKALATAAIDLSDGLSTDLTHLCEESGVAAEIDTTRLPVHPTATLDQALNGGEDYELLFTAPRSARIPKSVAGVLITQIGRIIKQDRGRATITIKTQEGSRPLKPTGWQHFA